MLPSTFPAVHMAGVCPTSMQYHTKLTTSLLFFASFHFIHPLHACISLPTPPQNGRGYRPLGEGWEQDNRSNPRVTRKLSLKLATQPKFHIRQETCNVNVQPEEREHNLRLAVRMGDSFSLCLFAF